MDGKNHDEQGEGQVQGMMYRRRGARPGFLRVAGQFVLVAASAACGCYMYSAMTKTRNPYGPRIILGVPLAAQAQAQAPSTAITPTELKGIMIRSIGFAEDYLQEGLGVLRKAFRSLAKDTMEGQLPLLLWEGLEYLKPPKQLTDSVTKTLTELFKFDGKKEK